MISALMFLELFFFAVLAPLLPGLKRDLDLSTAQAGLLVAMYALGALGAAIPATLIAVRVGVKPTALVSLVTFAAMSIAFGLVHSYPALLAARFAQGVAGAALWTAAMAWLLETAPAPRRGEMLGFAFGVSEAGAIAGPVMGGLAAAVGRAPTFIAIAVCCLLLAAVVTRFAPPPAIVERRRRIPLILSAAAAAVGILIRPMFGRWSDREGPLRPLRLGLLASCPVVLAVPWIESRWALPLFVIGALVFTGVLWAPLMVMLSDACTAAGGGQVM